MPALVHAQSTEPQNSELPSLVVEAKKDAPYAVKKTTTATKTDTPLIDTPQSITILSKELLEDTAVHSIGDAVRYVPGVGTAQGEGNRDTVVFRGSSSTGDYFVDGLRDDVQYYRDFYNIEQVEVLKGPSGMIFGRGGPGGVLNRVTKQAVIGDKSSFYEFSGLAGSWDQYRTTFDANQSLDCGRALRMTGLYENSDSFRDGVWNERIGVNPTFGWAIDDQTTLRAGFEYFNDERVADRGIPSFNGKPYDTDESTFFGNSDLSHADVEMFAFTALVDHKFSENITLRNATRFATYDKFYQNVFAGGPVTPADTVAISAYNNATERDNFFNQTDVVFKFDTGKIGHTLLTGLELSSQKTDNFRNTGFSDAAGTAPLGEVSASHPRYNGPLFFRQSATDADNHGVAEGVALSLQDQIQLLPQLQMIAGLRADFLNVDFHNNRTGDDIETNDDLYSPRLGFVYKPIENLAFYTSYAKSYVPRAGEQLGSLALTNASLDPEEFENYEIGTKWDATERLSFTLAAYHLERSNQAVVDPLDAAKLILVDGQEVEGIELGVSGQITDCWSIAAGYAYQQGETQSTNGLIPDGTPIQQLPEHSLSVWNRYDFNEHWGVGLGAIYRDEIFAAADNAVSLPSFVRFDAGLFYRHDEHLSAQLNVENLFSEDYFATAHSNDNITPGSPTAVRLGLTYKF